MMLRDELKSLIAKAAGVKPKEVFLEHPENPVHGDYATNIALVFARKEKRDPLEIAKRLATKLSARGGSALGGKAEVTVAAPGFLNFTLSENALRDELREILKKGAKYAVLTVGKGRKVNVEFISANPTGPLHIGNARGGPLGDVIASVLEKTGYRVTREFYVNDVGGQVEQLGETLRWWYRKKQGMEEPFPERGYKGEFYGRLAEEIGKPKEESAAWFAKKGVEVSVEEMKNDVAAMGITFDRWTFESKIREKKTQKILKELKRGGYIIEKEGAKWLKGLEEGDRESVLIKSGEPLPTYFANDIAYHKEKYERKFAFAVDVWGANHYGHIARMERALSYLGIPSEWLKVVLYQYVRLKRGEEIEKMAKREGTYVTARQVLSVIPKEVFRFSLLLTAPNSHLDFDLEAAKDTSEKNPVYYVQYAHARIASILRKAPKLRGKQNLTLVKEPGEFALIRELIKWPEIVEDTTRDFQVQRIPNYAISLATQFHAFYRDYRVLGEDAELTKARLALVHATKAILADILGVLGVSAPERM